MSEYCPLSNWSGVLTLARHWQGIQANYGTVNVRVTFGDAVRVTSLAELSQVRLDTPSENPMHVVSLWARVGNRSRLPYQANVHTQVLHFRGI